MNEKINKLAKPAAVGIVVVALVYLLAGYLLGPLFVERALARHAAAVPGTRLAAADIAFDPLTLAARLDAIEFVAPDGTTLAAVRADVDLGLASLFRRGYVLDALHVEGPDIVLPAMPSLTPDAVARLADAVTGDAGAWPAARIGSLSITGGGLRSRTAGPQITALAVAANDVSISESGVAAARFDAAMRIDGNAATAAGTLTPAPLDLSVAVTLDGIDVAGLGIPLPGSPPTGTANVSAAAVLTGAAGGRRLRIERGRAEIAAPAWQAGPALAAAAGRVDIDFTANVAFADGIERAAADVTLSADAAALTERNGSRASRLEASQLSAALAVSHPPDDSGVTGRFELSGARLTPADRDDPAVVAERIGADDVAFSGSAVRIGTAQIDGATATIDMTAPGIELPGWFRDPRFSLDRLRVGAASVALVDTTPRPPLTIRAEAIGGELTGLGGTGTRLEGSLAGRLAETESGAIEFAWSPPAAGTGRRVMLDLNDLDAARLATYAANHTDALVTGGTLDLLMAYERNDELIVGYSDWQFRGLVLERLAPAAARPPSALPPGARAPRRLPLEFAAALGSDADGVIDLFVPLDSRLDRDGPDLPRLLGAALGRHIATTAAMPFEALAAAVDTDADALAEVPFTAGSADVTADTRTALELLAAALAVRPRLALIVPDDHTPAADRAALAAAQVRTHVALATADAARPTTPAELDFAAPRTQTVLDEFAGERLDAATLADLDARFEADVSADPAERAPYYAAVFTALAANEQIPDTTLRRLARFRAQAIAAALESLGVAPTRIEIASNAAAGASRAADVRVPLGLRPAGTPVLSQADR